MKTLLATRTRWPVLTMIPLAVVLTCTDAARAQRGQQPQRGGPPQPGGVPARQQPRPVIPPAQPPRQPFVPQPQRPVPLPQRQVVPGVFARNRGAVAPAEVAAPAGISQTLLYTVEIEGALLAGLVLVGIVRLATDRPRVARPADAEG